MNGFAIGAAMAFGMLVGVIPATWVGFKIGEIETRESFYTSYQGVGIVEFGQERLSVNPRKECRLYVYMAENKEDVSRFDLYCRKETSEEK